MSNNDNDSDWMEQFCVGDPLAYAMEGVSGIPSSDRRGHRTLQTPIKSRYGTDVQEDTANIIKELFNAIDATELVKAIRMLGYHELTEFDALLEGCDLDEDDDADLGRVMQELDVKLTYGHAPRTATAEQVANKKHRDSIYVPELINMAGDEGTVYMAKTLSTTAKVEMAWDLHDDNQVVVVDDYDKWESLLGWEKLKQFPHGKNKIKEELGNRLSPDLLQRLTKDETSDDDTKDDDSTDSRGRRTRTKPSDEVLNIAINSRHRARKKIKSEDILEGFKENGHTFSDYDPVKMLVLFPTTCDLNMTDHWWVAGEMQFQTGYVAIANCNKGTFEYLNQRDEVWHIEDYLSQAGDYEFETNHGPVTMDTINTQNLVLHVLGEESYERFTNDTVMPNLPQVIPDYCEKELFHSPEFPHPDDMLYAPLTMEDVFWLRPKLRKEQNPRNGDAVMLYGDSKPRNCGNMSSLSSDYKLYVRARLNKWNFDSVEMKRLDKASHYFRLDTGGYEFVETLGQLHDSGGVPFSQRPEQRWDN